jgi:hypothetical protein
MQRLTDKDLWNKLWDFTLGTQLPPEKLNIIEEVMAELKKREFEPTDNSQPELF